MTDEKMEQPSENRLLFKDVMDLLIKEGKFTEARRRKYLKWIQDANKARLSGSLKEKENQYDKSEELLAWYTFAPLVRMTPKERINTLNDILKPALGADVLDGDASISFERRLPPSPDITKSISDHPVRYIRKKIAQHKEKRIKLEGLTQVDILIETDHFVIPIECKFTSDIDYQTEYSLERNQIARTIEASLELVKNSYGEKKIIFLLCVPKVLYNASRFYYYKMEDYRDIRKIEEDLKHRTDSLGQYVHGCSVVFWEDVADRIQSKSQEFKRMNKDEFDFLRGFYKERNIDLSI